MNTHAQHHDEHLRDPRDEHEHEHGHGHDSTAQHRGAVAPDLPPAPLPASPMDGQRAEFKLLGAIVDALDPVDGLRLATDEHDLTPASFGNPRARSLFAAMLALAARGEPVDVGSIPGEVRRRGEAGRFDGYDPTAPEHADRVGLWLTAQLGRSHSPRHLESFAVQVARAATIRQAHSLARGMALDIAQASDLADPDRWAEFAAGYGAALAECLAPTRASAATVTADQVARETLEQIEREAEGDTISLSTGFPDLDLMISGKGPKPGALVIVSAAKKMGKTAFAWAMTRPQLFAPTPNGELSWGPRSKPTPVFWACSEMNNRELMTRFFADLTTTDTRAIAGGNREWLRDNRERLTAARGLFGRAPLTFSPDKHSHSLDRILAAIRRWRASHPVDPRTGLQVPALAVLDYLQRFTLPGTERLNGNDRTTRMLIPIKTLAQELGIVIVLLSQLNREVQKRENHRPRSSDNRDSGSIEQEADTLIGLYRSSVYAEIDNPEDWAHKQARYSDLQQGFATGAADGEAHLAVRDRDQYSDEIAQLRREISGAELHVMDNRHGPTGMVTAEFIGACQRWQPSPPRLRLVAA